MKKHFEILLTLLLFCLVIFTYKGQEKHNINGGKGYDGNYYYSMIEQFKTQEFPIVERLPFAKRVGTMYLIGTYSRVTGYNIFDSALHVNLFACLVMAILLCVWLRQFIERFWIRLVLMTFFLVVWHGPISSLFFGAISTDAWGGLSFMAGLLSLNHISQQYRKSKKITSSIILFSIIISVGCFFRESNATLALAIFFIKKPLKENGINLKNLKNIKFTILVQNVIKTYFNKSTIIFFLPFVMVTLTSFSVSLMIEPITNYYYSYPKALVRWFYNKSFIELLTAFFIAYGPLLTLIPFYFKQSLSLLKNREDLLFIFATALFFGYLGGGDTERIFFMSSFPIIFIFLANAIEKAYYSKDRWWLFIIFALQTLALRVYWHKPAFPSDTDNLPIPFITLLGDQFQYLYLFSNHGNMYLNTTLFLEYCMIIALNYFIIKKQVFKHKAL